MLLVIDTVEGVEERVEGGDESLVKIGRTLVLTVVVVVTSTVLRRTLNIAILRISVQLHFDF